jgi:ribonuclease HI
MAVIQASPQQTFKRNRTENQPVLVNEDAVITTQTQTAPTTPPFTPIRDDYSLRRRRTPAPASRVQAGSHTPRNQQTTPTPPATPGAPTHEPPARGDATAHTSRSQQAAPSPPTPRGRATPASADPRAQVRTPTPRGRGRPTTAETARPIASQRFYIYFDGGYRPNQGKAVGAAWVHWDCWSCQVLGPNATSQKAEIIGAYSAALLVLDYITNTYVNGDPIPEFVFRGDSSYVCNKFPSSEELSEHVIRTVRATNTSNKEEMLLLLDALNNINFKWRFEWVPRQ